MILEPKCWTRRCKHYTGIINDGDEMTERPACRAYPDGIPEDIAYGNAKHLQVRDDQDNEIVYEKDTEQ